MGHNWNEEKVNVCKWVNDGMRVIAMRDDPSDRKPQYATVVTSMGVHARIRFEDGIEVIRCVSDICTMKETL